MYVLVSVCVFAKQKILEQQQDKTSIVSPVLFLSPPKHDVIGLATRGTSYNRVTKLCPQFSNACPYISNITMLKVMSAPLLLIQC